MEKKIQSVFQLFRFYLILGLVLTVFSMATNISECRAAHGISIDGKLKYTPDFKQFDYTSEQARKGGALVLHDLGSYDKMNPFTLKGSAWQCLAWMSPLPVMA
jgi:ABC-type oligopeptide transport system substrate-binding subunit